MDQEPDLFTQRKPPPPPPPQTPKLKVDLHSRYRTILREMKKSGSRIVVFSFAGKGLHRIRLEHWPRHKGISEKGFRALVDGGFVRKQILHPKSKAFPRYDLTTLGDQVASI